MVLNKCLNCGESVNNKYCNVGCQNKHQQKNRKKSKSSIKKRSETIKSKWKVFIVKCFICKKEIEITEFNTENPKKEKYHCSISCANTRRHSEQTKKKISKSVKLFINKDAKDVKVKKYTNGACLFCNKIFLVKNKKQKYCSLSCSNKASGGWLKARKNLTKEKWSKINKNAYESGTNYVAGGTTKWYNYKDIKVQGTYELRTCFILDNWKQMGKIKDWEYTNDRIKYIDENGKERNYLLDFKIIEENDKFYYIETKGWEKPNDKLKWKAVKDKGCDLIIWFDKDIIKEEKLLNILRGGAVASSLGS